MRVLAHPLRIDSSGAIATVEQGSLAQAAHLAQAVASTVVGERQLAPDFGIPDPTGVGVTAEALIAAVGLAESDIEVVDVDLSGGEEQKVVLTVAWVEA